MEEKVCVCGAGSKCVCMCVWRQHTVGNPHINRFHKNNFRHTIRLTFSQNSLVATSATSFLPPHIANPLHSPLLPSSPFFLTNIPSPSGMTAPPNRAFTYKLISSKKKIETTLTAIYC